MARGATIPSNSNIEDGQAYSICLPSSDNNLWYSIVTGLLIQLSYGYFWDKNSGDIEEAKAIGSMIVNAWLDGECLVPTCEEVASCIANNASVQNALNAWFANSEYAKKLAKIEAELAKPVIVPAPAVNCLDSAYSALVAIIDELDASIVDFYEQAELVTNIAEFASNIAEFLSSVALVMGQYVGVGIAEAIDSVADWTNQIKDNLFEQYQAGITAELKTQFVCDILCMYGCDFTLDDIRNYFKNEVSSSAEFDNVLDIIDYLVVGNFLGELSVKASFYATLETIHLTNQLFYFFTQQPSDGITRLRKVGQVGANNPLNDWQLLCACGMASDIIWLASLPLVAPSLNSGDILTSTRALNDGAGSFIGYGQYLGGSISRLSSSQVVITHAYQRSVISVSFYSRVNGGGTGTAYLKYDGTQVNFTRPTNGTRVKHTFTFPSATNVLVFEFFVSAQQTYSGSYIEGIEINYA